MKYAYPQNPTHAVSAIKRIDESSDSSTSQSNLERQQDIAVVGETVPLIFCERKDWGGDAGTNGGIWISPRLIQLGVKEFSLSMMYLLSQGKITGLTIDKVFWGYNKLADVDETATVELAYEQVPSNLSLDYDPGGSLSWTTTRTFAGPDLGRVGSTQTIQTGSKVIKLTLQCTVDSYQSGAYAYVTSDGGSYCGREGNFDNCSNDIYYHKNYGGNPYSDVVSLYGSTRCYYTSTWNRYASWSANIKQFQEIQVFDQSGTLVKEFKQTLTQGANTITIDGLPADKYTVQIKNYGDPWDLTLPSAYVGSSGGCTTHNQVVRATNTRPPSGSVNRGYQGSDTSVSTVTTTVVETVYNELQFPDLPGGDQQIVGGLSDLTMLGISGDILKLRPDEGPDYFLQAHVFVETGIEVTRLLTDDVGPSSMYPDLVYYLMQKTKVLQADQIDVDALRKAAQLCQTYQMHFNGVLQTTNSLSEWMLRTSPYFLLTPRQVDGKYGLWPVCPMNAAGELSRDVVQPAMVITADDIVSGSYSRQYISPIDRRPICLIMVYRDQPTESVGQTVTVEVRYPGTALSGPFESHDLTEHCCRPEQAVYAARYILAKRRFTTHTASFTLGRRAAQLKPGDIVRVDLDLATTDGDGITDSVFYQLESLSEGTGGQVIVEATHFPVDSSGVSVVAKETHAGAVTIQ